MCQAHAALETQAKEMDPNPILLSIEEHDTTNTNVFEEFFDDKDRHAERFRWERDRIEDRGTP